MLVAGSVAQLGGFSMANLLIPNIDEALHARLKARAAEHRRSLEEEARELLRAAVAPQETAPQENLVDLARRLFGIWRDLWQQRVSFIIPEIDKRVGLRR
jgi:plasmid stability protein